MLATIPFPCDSLNEAQQLMRQMTDAEILRDTRGDKLEISLTPSDPHFPCYVVVHTGNIRGMVADLEDCRFLS